MSRLRWFGHVMQMREKNDTHQSGWKMTNRKTQNQMDRPNQKGVEMKGENQEEIQENRSGTIEIAGDDHVILSAM